MTINKLINSLKEQALITQSNIAHTQLGVITAYDPSIFQVKVQLYVETEDDPALITNFIPLASPWIGNGWGMYASPNLGDMVLVSFQNGDYQSPIAALRVFAGNQPVKNVPSGEFWLFHQSGSFIKMKNDGSIEINSNTVKLGNLASSLHKLVTDDLISAYNNHRHTDPQGGTTGVPTTLLTTSVLTVNTEAT